jgi:hypothetical protein
MGGKRRVGQGERLRLGIIHAGVATNVTRWVRLHAAQEMIERGQRGAPASAVVFEALVDRQQIGWHGFQHHIVMLVRGAIRHARLPVRQCLRRCLPGYWRERRRGMGDRL